MSVAAFFLISVDFIYYTHLSLYRAKRNVFVEKNKQLPRQPDSNTGDKELSNHAFIVIR